MKHLTILDKGPVLLYLHQLELSSSLWAPGECELVVGLWTQKAKSAAKGAEPDSPRLAQKVGKNFSLLIERRCSPGPSGRFEARFLQSPADRERSRSFGRFIDRVKGTSFNEAPAGEEMAPAAPAVPLPKDTDLSTQFCLTVRKENSSEVLAVGMFHLWELVYSADRRVALSLGRRLLSEECTGSLRQSFSPLTKDGMNRAARRHSWAGLLHPGHASRSKATERSLPRVPSPKRASGRRRHKSVSFADNVDEEDMQLYPEMPSPLPVLSGRRVRRESYRSDKSGSALSGSSASVPGIAAVSLAPSSISQRDGGVVGIPRVGSSVLAASLRRAFDVPYDSSWVVGKSPDPLLQATYDFWGASHALIPQKVTVEGVLLFEDLYKQNKSFVVPRALAGGGGEWGGNFHGGAVALTFSQSSDNGSGGKLRLDQALRLRSAHVRQARGEEGDLKSAGSPNAAHKEVSFVDNELLMYKINIWNDTKTVEPQTLETWAMLPGDRVYTLRGEMSKSFNAPRGGLLGTSRSRLDSPPPREAHAS